MKISEKNTALGLLDKINPWAFTISEDGDHSTIEYKRALGLSVVKEFPKVASLFKNKVQYISQPFYEAFLRGQSKLVNVLGNDEIDESGTFISRSSPSETNTIFYYLQAGGSKENFKMNAVIFFFNKSTEMDKPSLAIVVQRNQKGFKSYLSDVAVKNGLDEMKVIVDIYTLILFMKYCDTETKTIKPGKKDKHIGVKYVNETTQNIEVLDSTWFTTIIRGEGFGVRGHFRMQPFGPGMLQKKLIWIADFEKSGYTRKAKVLQEHYKNTQQ